MKLIWLSRITLLVGIAIVIVVGIAVKPAVGQCDSKTDADIVVDVYAKIKADRGLVGQVSHINVVSVSLAVKFQGWADSKSDYDKIVNIGMTTNCARLMNVNAFYDTPPPTDSSQRASQGCATGTKACGDVCIPENDPCNIKGAKGAVADLFTMPMPRGFGFLSVGAGCN